MRPEPVLLCALSLSKGRTTSVRQIYIDLVARVMAVSFERYGRLYYLDPG